MLAFYNNSIKNIIIPRNVIYIGGSAFANNTLSEVTFESNSFIRVISNSVFAGNSNLSPIQLPINANPGFIGYKRFYKGYVESITEFSTLIITVFVILYFT